MFYNELSELREKDKYPNDEFKEKMIDTFFPKSANNLTQDLSNVTSAFYGFLLVKISKVLGSDQIDTLSRELFYELGKLKTNQATEKMKDMPYDTRAFAIISLSAIYNASPEYQISIEEFSQNHTVFILTGTDRYHKIAKNLGIDEHLSWPTLTPFMEAINVEMGLNAMINIELLSLAQDSETICKYEFKNKN